MLCTIAPRNRPTPCRIERVREDVPDIERVVVGVAVEAADIENQQRRADQQDECALHIWSSPVRARIVTGVHLRVSPPPGVGTDMLSQAREGSHQYRAAAV